VSIANLSTANAKTSNPVVDFVSIERAYPEVAARSQKMGKSASLLRAKLLLFLEADQSCDGLPTSGYDDLHTPLDRGHVAGKILVCLSEAHLLFHIASFESLTEKVSVVRTT